MNHLQKLEILEEIVPGNIVEEIKAYWHLEERPFQIKPEAMLDGFRKEYPRNMDIRLQNSRFTLQGLVKLAVDKVWSKYMDQVESEILALPDDWEAV